MQDRSRSYAWTSWARSICGMYTRRQMPAGHRTRLLGVHGRVPEDEPSVVACGVVVVAPRVAAAVTWWWRCFFLYFSKYFLRSVGLALGNVFAECSTKNTRQRNVCRLCVRRVPFAECNTRQRICRVYIGLCRVPEALGKEAVSGSDSI